MRKSLKFIVSLLLALIVFEGFARILPILAPKWVHSPYQKARRPPHPLPYSKGATRYTLWKTNGVGARADFHRGQPLTVAVFGGSQALDSRLSQEHTWAEKLSQKLGFHVENYAEDGSHAGNAIEVINHLHSQGRKFDAVLLLTRYPQHWEINRQTFRHWGPKSNQQQTLRTVATLRHYYQKYGRKYGWLPAQKPKKNHHPRDPKNIHLRKEGKVQFEPYWTEPKYLSQRLAEGTAWGRELLKSAKRVSHHIYLIVSPVAFDPEQLPSVTDRWYLLDPVPGKEDKYIDDASQARVRRLDQKALRNAAISEGVQYIHLDNMMRILLASRSDLFYDHVHFTPQGAEVAASLLANSLQLKPPFRGQMDSKHTQNAMPQLPKNGGWDY